LVQSVICPTKNFHLIFGPEHHFRNSVFVHFPFGLWTTG
jgi:hypothetical protein